MLLVFIVALLARAGWGTLSLIRADSPTALTYPDEEQYWSMADSLADGNGMRDELGFRATRMPLYPGILSLCARFDSGLIMAKALQWFLGAAGAVFAAMLAARVAGPRAGLLAGVLVGVDPFLVFFSSLLLTETLLVTLLCGLWCLVWPWMAGKSPASFSRACLVGLVAAACVYARPSSVGLLVLLGLVLVVRGRFSKRAIAAVGISTVIVVASLVPWAMRNQHVTGRWCWLTLRGGISLYDGVRPDAAGDSDLGNVKNAPQVAGMDEVQWNDHFMREATRLIAEDPVRIVRLATVKFLRTWNLFPNVATHQSTLVRLVSGGWMTVVLVAAIIGIVRHRRAGLTWLGVMVLLLPAVYLTLLHCLFVGSVRYRLPAMPMIEVLAAVAITCLINGTRYTGGNVPEQ